MASGSMSPLTSGGGSGRMGRRRLHLIALFAAQATCSVSMVLLNKTIAESLDFPWTVVFIQNVGSVLIGYLFPCLCGGGGRAADGPKQACNFSMDLEAGQAQLYRRLFGMKVPRRLKNQLWVALQVAFFMATLFTSLRALRFISVPLYVVARNTVPAQTALLERVFMGVRVSVWAVVGLLATILGAVLYTYGDLQHGLAFGGCAYAVLLTLIVSGASVVDKTVVRMLGQEEDIRPAECNQLRVALALPVNLLFAILFEGGAAAVPGDTLAAGGPPPDWRFGAALARASGAVLASLFMSTLLGYGMGTFNFYLQQSVSAATVQVANIFWKLCTTVISLATHPTPVSGVSWMGYAVSLAGVALYTFAPRTGFALCGGRCTEACGGRDT